MHLFARLRPGVFTLALCLVSCLFTTRAGEEKVIPIGVCLSVSGRFGHYGKVDLAGIHLRLAEFNQNPRDPNLRLILHVADDHSNPDTASGVVSNLIDTGKLSVVLGPVDTTIIKTIAPTIEMKKTVLISPTVTDSAVLRDNPWIFGMLFSNEQQGIALAEFARKNLGLTHAAAIINDYFTYGSSIFTAFRQRFEELGGTIVSVQRYRWNLLEAETPNFINLLDDIKAARPEFIVLPNYSEEAIAIIQQSQIVNLKRPFLGTDAWFTPELFLAAGNNLQNCYYTSSSDFSSERPEMKHFLDLFEMSNDPDASYASVDAYDALSVVIEALKHGSDSEEIREGLYSLKNFPLAGSDITFDREKGTIRPVFIHKIISKDGDFTFETAARIDPKTQ